MKIITLKCENCGLEFVSEYWHGGMIEHDNYCNDRNMKININRVKNVNDDFHSKERFFFDSIGLDENFCNIKDNVYKVGLQIFECRIIWLRKHGYNDLADYLESRRKDIKTEFNKITYKKIIELKREISDLKKKIL